MTFVQFLEVHDSFVEPFAVCWDVMGFDKAVANDEIRVIVVITGTIQHV